jgi:hypothetical protein
VLCCCLSNSAVLPMIDTTGTAAAAYVLWVWVRPAGTPSQVCVLILSHPHKLSSSRSDQAPKTSSDMSVGGQQGCLTFPPCSLPCLCLACWHAWCPAHCSFGACGRDVANSGASCIVAALIGVQPRHQLAPQATALLTPAGPSRAAERVAAKAFLDLRLAAPLAGHD